MISNIIYFFYVIIKNYIGLIFRIQNYDQTIILILKELGQINVTFAKIFQWSFMDENKSNKYITTVIYQYLYNYTNNTPYNSQDIDYKSILSIYKIAKENNDIFYIDNIEPINSGTISLVFKAKLNDKDVVIKLLRKDIKKKIVEGIDLLTTIGYMLSLVPNISLFMIDKIIEKNKDNFYSQVDFLNEIKNIELFYKSFEKNKFIIVPNVYKYYTEQNSNIIIMDWIEGETINKLTKEEKINFIIPLVKLTKNFLLVKKIMHCDLHQGNILFIKKNINNEIIYQLGLIDFGMAIKLEINDCNFCYYFINGIFNNKFIDFVEFILDDNNIEYYFESVNMNNLKKLKEKLLHEQKINNFFSNQQMDNVITDIYTFLKLLKENKCEISKNIHKIILSLIPLFSVIVGLGNDEKNNYIIVNEFKNFNNDKLIENL